MSQHKDGSVGSANTVKAGCGIRYDPEVIGDDTGFDFSEAEELLKEKSEQNDKKEARSASGARSVRLGCK